MCVFMYLKTQVLTCGYILVMNFQVFNHLAADAKL